MKKVVLVLILIILLLLALVSIIQKKGQRQTKYLMWLGNMIEDNSITISNDKVYNLEKLDKFIENVNNVLYDNEISLKVNLYTVEGDIVTKELTYIPVKENYDENYKNRKLIIKTDYSDDSYSSQEIVNEEYLMQPYKMERKFLKEENLIQIILKRSNMSSDVQDEVELFEYELKSTDYIENNHLYYAQRKDMGVDKINSEENFDIYVVGGNVTIAKDNEEAKDFSEAIATKNISIDEILKQAEIDSKYGVCRRGFYSDGGTIEYDYQEYTLIKANTLAGNKDFIIAPPNMIWSEISKIVYKL